MTAILQGLPERGTVVLDASTAARTVITVTPTLTALRDLCGDEVILGPNCRGWIRRIAPPDWDDGIILGSGPAAELRAQLALLGAILRDDRPSWLSRIDQITSAENKLMQYRAASTLGIRIPRTLVASKTSDLFSTLGDPLVLKPLGPGHFVDQEGQERVLYVRPVFRDDFPTDDLGTIPFLAQELLIAEKHLRVVTVNKSVWIAEQEAAGLPVDWRASQSAHLNFGASATTTVAEPARQLAAAMGVGYTSQDWIICEGQPYFLDLNPGGQWLFLPEEICTGISEAVTAWLNVEEPEE